MRARRLAAVLTDLDRLLREDAWQDRDAPSYLSPAQAHVLTYVTRQPGPTEREIARHLHVTGPTVVHMVDALERRGLVTRARTPPDRRVVRIAVTEEGERVVHDYTVRQEQRVAQIVARLPSRSVTALLRTLTALLAAWEDHSRG